MDGGVKGQIPRPTPSLQPDKYEIVSPALSEWNLWFVLQSVQLIISFNVCGGENQLLIQRHSIPHAVIVNGC